MHEKQQQHFNRSARSHDMPLTSFAEVQQFFNEFINQNNIQLDLSPHGPIWQQTNSAQDYDLFVNGNVPGVVDPDTNNPIPILMIKDSKNSAIVQALLGTTTLFDPNSPQPPYFGRMPAGGPYFTAAQIQEFA